MARRTYTLGIRTAVIAGAIAMMTTFVGGAAFAEESTGSISGSITDSRGVPLHSPRHLQLKVLDESGDQVGAFAQVAADGTYSVEGLAAGSYRIEVQDWEHSYLYEFFGGARNLEQASEIQVNSGQATVGIDVALDLSIVLSGHVVGPGGEPIDEGSWIQVSAYDESGSDVGGARTRDDSSFELGEIPTGRYRLAFYDTSCAYGTEYFNNANELVGAELIDVVRGEIRNLGTIELARSSGACTPDAPSAKPLVTSSGGQLSASWTPTPSEGSPVATGYVVTSLPAGAGCATTGATNCVLSAVAVGTDYRFFVSAVNAAGSSLPSPPSDVVRGPSAPVAVAPSRDFVGKKQKVTKKPSNVGPGRSKSLPARSNAGVKVKWKSLTPRKCVVRSGKVYGRDSGKCRLKAVAKAKGSWLRYESITIIRVR